MCNTKIYFLWIQISKTKYIGPKCCCFSPLPQPYRPLFGQIKKFEIIVFTIDVQKKFISPFCFASPEIIGAKFFTDSQTNYLKPNTGVLWIFLSVEFATSLTHFARRGIIFLIQNDLRYSTHAHLMN